MIGEIITNLANDVTLSIEMMQNIINEVKNVKEQMGQEDAMHTAIEGIQSDLSEGLEELAGSISEQNDIFDQTIHTISESSSAVMQEKDTRNLRRVSKFKNILFFYVHLMKFSTLQVLINLTP